jgi:hypothetical protein
MCEYRRSLSILASMSAKHIVKWQALISGHLIVTYRRTKLYPICQDSTQIPCQKDSHRVYALQGAYLG